jgi:hypothetical protein
VRAAGIYLKHETSVWLEITGLLIPGENDSPAEIVSAKRYPERCRALGRLDPISLAWLMKRGWRNSVKRLLSLNCRSDPHHHLWNQAGNVYLFPELLADLSSGHKIRATVLRRVFRSSLGNVFAGGAALSCATALQRPVAGLTQQRGGERSMARRQRPVIRERRPRRRKNQERKSHLVRRIGEAVSARRQVLDSEAGWARTHPRTSESFSLQDALGLPPVDDLFETTGQKNSDVNRRLIAPASRMPPLRCPCAEHNQSGRAPRNHRRGPSASPSVFG